MYHYVLETVPQLSALHFNLAPKPLVISAAGTSCRLQKLNYSEAFGLSEAHCRISASAVSAAVLLGYQGTSLHPMRKSRAEDEGACADAFLNQCSLNRAWMWNVFSCRCALTPVMALLTITHKYDCNINVWGEDSFGNSSVLLLPSHFHAH